MRNIHGLGFQRGAQSSLHLAFADRHDGFAQGQGPQKTPPGDLGFSGTGV
jgi:hypothetical protein